MARNANVSQSLRNRRLATVSIFQESRHPFLLLLLLPGTNSAIYNRSVFLLVGFQAQNPLVFTLHRPVWRKIKEEKRNLITNIRSFRPMVRHKERHCLLSCRNVKLPSTRMNIDSWYARQCLNVQQIAHVSIKVSDVKKKMKVSEWHTRKKETTTNNTLSTNDARFDWKFTGLVLMMPALI